MKALNNNSAIIVKLMGGLGNQMFQYAAGRSLAIKHNASLYLDTNFLTADPGPLYTKRDYELDQLNIKATIADEEIIKQAIGKSKNIFEKLFKRNNSTVYDEQKNGFNKVFENLSPPVYLNGFWQSEKYFLNVRELLLEEFTPAYEFTPEEVFSISEVTGCNSVSIHVRRGDYVHLKSAAEYHGVCGMEYYSSAIDYINGKVNDPRYYIFSDDLEWCRENFKNVEGITFVDGKNKYASFDLYLMSRCKHNIIANSSYSWWGAWLNQNMQKTVIAPEKWFAPGVPVNKDLLPPYYILL